MPIRVRTFSRLSREALWIVFGQFMAVAGALVGVRLLTELLTPDSYGELALGMTLATLVHQLIFWPISNGAMRFYASAAELGQVASYSRALAQQLAAAIALISLLGMLLFLGLKAVDQTSWIALALAALGFAVLAGCNTVANGIQNAARRRSTVALHHGLESWTRYLLAAALLFALEPTSHIAMIAYALSALMLLSSHCYFLRKLLPTRSLKQIGDQDWPRELWAFAWPMSAFGIFTWMQAASDRWSLSAFATTQDVGLYAVLFQLSYYPTSVATALVIQLLAPIMYAAANTTAQGERASNTARSAWRLAALAIAVTCVATLLAYFFHAPIFRLLVADEYGVVSHYLPWMLLAGGLFAAGQTVMLELMRQLRTRAMLVAKSVTALFGIALNIVGAYSYGMVGVVFAALTFSTMYLAWMLALSRRVKTEGT